MGHDGGDGKGEFIQTLDVTGVCTSWTETQAVRNKAQVWVFEALEGITEQLPFEIKGIDSVPTRRDLNSSMDIYFGFVRKSRLVSHVHVLTERMTIVL